MACSLRKNAFVSNDLLSKMNNLNMNKEKRVTLASRIETEMSGLSGDFISTKKLESFYKCSSLGGALQEA